MNCPSCSKAISGAYEAGSYACSGCGGQVQVNPTKKKKPSKASGKRFQRKLMSTEKAQLDVARRTLRTPDPILGVMGGLTKAEAREIIIRLTGKAPKENPAKKNPDYRKLNG